MKAEPLIVNPDSPGYVRCAPEDATHVRLCMPGPLENRILPVILKGSRRDHPGACWSWNGSIDKPTLKPSILTRGRDEKGEHVCHSWVNDGQVKFLGDCSHSLANQTVDLLDID